MATPFHWSCIVTSGYIFQNQPDWKKVQMCDDARKNDSHLRYTERSKTSLTSDMRNLISGFWTVFPEKQKNKTALWKHVFLCCNLEQLSILKPVGGERKKEQHFFKCTPLHRPVITEHNGAESLHLWKVLYNGREVGEVYHSVFITWLPCEPLWRFIEKIHFYLVKLCYRYSLYKQKDEPAEYIKVSTCFLKLILTNEL